MLSLPLVQKVSYGVLGTGVVLFLWQHVARTQGWTVKPSIGFQKFADGSVWAWEKTGRLAAYVSSYLTYLNFGEMANSLQELALPVGEVLQSPLAFFKGYAGLAMQYKYPVLVGFGSMGIMGVLAFLGHRYGWVASLVGLYHRMF
jgi:hypothetical protein